MKKAALTLLAAATFGCSHTVVVPVPARVDLKPYGMIGIIEFSTNGERATGLQATRAFQEQVQEAQPGTRFLELGKRDAVLAGVGARDFDPEALRRIGEKYRLKALVVGELAYSPPSADIKVVAEISGRLLETSSGASVWTRSAWTQRQIGTLSVSAGRGVGGSMSKGDPREEMVPSLVYHLTHDFRPNTVPEER
ncbi:MAG TPA: hypothetical protein VJQ58_03390 [Burkholderiales bacterium]|jgi:hypothetical protein|nr:hypothetical protein [Burkholderiales bacterium]